MTCISSLPLLEGDFALEEEQGGVGVISMAASPLQCILCDLELISQVIDLYIVVLYIALQHILLILLTPSSVRQILHSHHIDTLNDTHMTLHTVLQMLSLPLCDRQRISSGVLMKVVLSD